MKLLPPEPDIKPDEGFEKHDIFNHAPFGQSLENLFTNIEDPLVLLLDAPWGAGKSTFIKMWAGHMRNKGFPVIEFDAFEHDYLESAFEAISGEILAFAKTKKEEKKKPVNSLNNAGTKTLEMIKRLTPNTTKTITAAVVKQATKKLVGEEGYQEVAAEITSDLAVTTIDQWIQEKKKGPDDFTKFKQALSNLAKELTTLEKTPQDDETPPENRQLIFIIDELDRCRPTFALELLEKIKHFFSIEGISFVLVSNVEQLECAVAHTYGTDKQASLRYLEKFYHILTHLPETDQYDQLNIEKFIQHQSQQLPREYRDATHLHHCGILLIDIAKRKDFKLRTINRIWSNYLLCLSSMNMTAEYPSILIIALCILKSDNPQLYKKAKSKTLLYIEIENYFHIKNILDEEKDENEPTLSFLKKWLNFSLFERNKSYFDTFSNATYQYAYNRKDLISYLIENIVDRYEIKIDKS